MRTLGLFGLLFPAISMATIIQSDPVPVISTICTVGGSPVVCGNGAIGTVYGSEHVGADASISILGIGTSTGLDIEAWAEAVAGTWGITRDSLGSSATASVNLDFLGSTDGPERQGFATYLIDSDGDHGGGGGGSSESSFIQGLGACQFSECVYRGTLVPFVLGVPFELGLSVSATGGSGQHLFDGGGSSAMLKLQLFEADGTPVTIYDPPASAPETASWRLAALGLLTLLIFRAKAIPDAIRRS